MWWTTMDSWSSLQKHYPCNKRDEHNNQSSWVGGERDEQNNQSSWVGGGERWIQLSK